MNSANATSSAVGEAPRVRGIPASRPGPGDTPWARYGGLPFIIEGVASEWPAIRKWNADYLIERAGDDPVRPFATNRVLQGTVLQQINRSVEMSFRDLVDHIFGRRRADAETSYYLRVEPGSPTYATLSADFTIPDTGRAFNPDWSGIWMGQKGNATPFHNDQWHGLLFQVSGYKRYTMVHPFDAPRLQAKWPAAARYDLSRADIVEADDPILATLELCYQGTLAPGEILYVPPFWMHQVVTLDDGNISLPLRFDTTQSPDVSLFQFSQKSCLRNLTNQPVRDREQILRFLRANRENFGALEREFVRALVEVRGLGDDVDSLLAAIAAEGSNQNA